MCVCMAWVDSYDITFVDEDDYRPFHCSMNIGYNPFPAWIDVYSRESVHKRKVVRYIPETEQTCEPIIEDNLNESEGNGDAWARCSECNAIMAVFTEGDSMPNYCFNCGRKVIS